MLPGVPPTPGPRTSFLSRSPLLCSLQKPFPCRQARPTSAVAAPISAPTSTPTPTSRTKGGRGSGDGSGWGTGLAGRRLPQGARKGALGEEARCLVPGVGETLVTPDAPAASCCRPLVRGRCSAALVLRRHRGLHASSLPRRFVARGPTRGSPPRHTKETAQRLRLFFHFFLVLSFRFLVGVGDMLRTAACTNGINPSPDGSGVAIRP